MALYDLFYIMRELVAPCSGTDRIKMTTEFHKLHYAI